MSERLANNVLLALTDVADILHRTISDDRHSLRVLERVLNECIQLRESHGIVIAYELVNQYDLAIYAR